MIKYYFFYIISFFLLSYVEPVLSCSMDMPGASGLVIQEIIKSIQRDNIHSDREISKIEKVHIDKLPYWTYIVELSKNGSGCHAVGYTANIDPSCNVKVERLKTSFVCK